MLAQHALSDSQPTAPPHSPTTAAPTLWKETDTYDDGRKRSETWYYGQLRHGAHDEYYPNGEAAVSGQYLDGKRHGCWLWKNEAGVGILLREYRDGAKCGPDISVGMGKIVDGLSGE